MPEGESTKNSPESGPARLILSPVDLWSGHEPGVKAPPWELTGFGSIEIRYPETQKAFEAAAKELKPGEERVVFDGEVQFPNGKVEEVEIKAVCRKYTSGSGIEMWIWPKAEKYYQKNEKTP